MYDAIFFDSIREGCRRSAEAVAAKIATMLNVRTDARVIDVGCGEGWWGKQFAEVGCHVVGYDQLPPSVAPVIPVQPVDLAESIPPGRFDIALSLEVAEHLPPERGPGFVADLCALAPTVIFSAAIPGQGGTGHLNERWPGYWEALFNDLGFVGTSWLRWEIWRDARVSWWYRQNLLVFSKVPGFADEFGAGCPDVIHPEMLAHRLR